MFLFLKRQLHYCVHYTTKSVMNEHRVKRTESSLSRLIEKVIYSVLVNLLCFYTRSFWIYSHINK